MATPTKYSSCLQNVVTKKKGFAGLAVVITNDYRQHKNIQTLPGAEKDGDNLSRALKKLNFCVYHVKNISCTKMHEIIQEVKYLKYEQAKKYSCIMFIFAGHGCETDELYMQDEKKVDPWRDIILPLLPGSCKALGSIPKVFLIDACRGVLRTKTMLSPRGCIDQEGIVLDRGGIDLNTQSIPAEGNFLLAWSTLPRHKAYEDQQNGGLWFSLLAQLLFDLEERMSIHDILTRVNARIVEKKCIQQPEEISRLNKTVFLEPYDGPICCSAPARTLPLALAPNFRGSGHPVCPQERPVPAFSSVPAVQHCQENFRTRFHEYCQREHLIPQYDYAQDVNGKQPTFNCTISFKKNGKTLRGDSGAYCLRKDEAKEKAAQSIMREVKQQCVQLSTCASIDSVSWKSKLKEYYDKKGQPGKALSYRIEPESGGVGPFKSHVFIEELGREVAGSMAKSKKDADQSAAHKALYTLQHNTLL